jgi:hypothetical protein
MEGATALWHDAIMPNSVALIVSALVIAAAILFACRWQAVTTPTQVYRLDRWTGKVAACKADVWSDSPQAAPRDIPAGYDIPCEKQ